VRFLTALWVLVLITACGGGGGGVGGGQSPDPVVVDVPLFYIQRAPVRDDDGQLESNDLRDPSAFNPGARLMMRDRASPSAAEKAITDRLFSGDVLNLYDVKDLTVDYDGDKILFALHKPLLENVDDDEQPTWEIWQYLPATDALSRVIESDIVAAKGHDTAPAVLVDGRIVFTSTRQQTSKARLLDEGKPQYAALAEGENNPASVLHIMDADGTDIQQLSFNQSHDLSPQVLKDGRIVFSRWDHMGSVSGMHLYTIRPDGTELSLYYGAHSHQTGTDNSTVQFTRALPLPNGELLSLIRPFVDTRGAQQLVRFNAEQFVDASQPINTSVIASASTQQNLTNLKLTTNDQLALGGRINRVQVLNDGDSRLLITWSPCRLQSAMGQFFACIEPHLSDTTLVEADPLFGIWLLDWQSNTQLPIVHSKNGLVISEAVVLETRSPASNLPDKTIGNGLEGVLANANVGALNIRSVYDFAGINTATDERLAQYLRIEKAVPIPDDDVVELSSAHFGVSSQQLMREVVGYVPIEADGSVNVAVPADVPLAISVLNQDGERITSRHQNWLQVRPGETRHCNGCHTGSNDLTPHGRINGEIASINPLTTLAEAHTQAQGLRFLTMDLNDQAGWRYADLLTTAPTTSECQTDWHYLCRSVINYVTHIQPLWELPRASGAQTCIACHSRVNAMNAAQVPAAQLELTGGVSADSAEQVVSYRELFFNDNEQELVGGVLTDRLIIVTDGSGNTVFQRDGNGNLLLDGAGQPIPQTRLVNVNPSMSAAGAAASEFLTIFKQASATVDHRSFLTNAELKLIREWLDMGGQYYNNPFDVPQD
jgi:hypothetical protein